MRLGEARLLFQTLRSGTIRVRGHAWRDHPERKFSAKEIMDLIRVARGTLLDNKMPSALPGSFLWCCSDVLDRRCELVVIFEVDEETKNYILVVSAWRKV